MLDATGELKLVAEGWKDGTGLGGLNTTGLLAGGVKTNGGVKTAGGLNTGVLAAGGEKRIGEGTELWLAELDMDIEACWDEAIFSGTGGAGLTDG